MELKTENEVDIVLLWFTDKHGDEHETFICPFCKRMGFDENVNVQCDDYVKEPMLWCDSCGARSFLDVDLNLFFDIIDSKSIDNEYYSPLENGVHAYKFHLKKVKKVLPNNFDYTSNVQLTDQQVRELCELNYYNYKQLTQETIKKYDLREIKEDNYEEYDEKLMNVALTCDSYNVMKPTIPYPKSARFNHDGIYLRCKVENKEGNIKNTCFWGD